jgi:hypothetical protein
MPYLKPADPMQNRSAYLPGYMYQLHIPWHFFNALLILGKRSTRPTQSYSIQNIVQAISGHGTGGNIIQRRSECIPGDFPVS